MAQAKRSKLLIRSFLKRIFCRRNIIIISEHKVDHIPVNVLLQLGLLLAIIGVVGWVSYSTGSYMAAQSVLEEKEEKIRTASQVNQRIASEFALLKRDLMAMAEDAAGNKPDNYKQYVLEQYKENDSGALDVTKDMNRLTSVSGGAVMKRIEYLEEKMMAMQENHDSLIDTIRNTTQGKIVELENIISHTGLNAQTLEQQVLRSKTPPKIARSSSATEKNDPQGGPFYPESKLNAGEEAELMHDVLRMMALNEVVGKLPLDKPMITAKTTSGFGMRIDPFRKRPARHTGIDFAGERGSKIYSTNEGTVIEAGWRGAYGNAVEVLHGHGVSTLYGHLSQILVKEGQKVAKGQPVGIQGSTGRSTGNHLHYEVRIHNTPVNPNRFLQARNNVQTH